MPSAQDLASTLRNVAWPAMLSGTAAQLVALQFQFEKSQWWPHDVLRAHQFSQLQRLVQHAARTIPFHADRLRAAGIDPAAPLTEQAWRRLPVLTRADVQQNGEALCATSLPAGHGSIGTVTTGGSTGIPVRGQTTELAGLMWSAACIRDEIWNREHVPGRLVRIRGTPLKATPEIEAQALSAEGLTGPKWGAPQSWLWQTGPVATIHFMRPIPEQIDYMQRLRADYLFTYPSNLRLLLAYCRNAGIRFPGLRSIWTTSETLEPAVRALCHDVLGVRIVHNYSAAETGYIALQCPEHEHYHVQSELVLVEVLDADGRACAPGDIGRVVVTPLHNFAMPLLRYEIGDEAEVGAPCPCGRGLPVLTQVVGRVAEHLTLPWGAKRRTDLNHYRLAAITAIREYQVVQRSVDQIELRLVVAHPLSPAERDEVMAILVQEFVEGFSFDLTFWDAIPRTEAGKLRPFISELYQAPK
jgi:phenylacetate-CoA ligase